MAENEPESPPKRIEEKVLLSWNAPTRPFKRRAKDFYVSLIAISSLVGLILFIIEGIMPVILLISLVFLFYVLSTVEPEKIEYQITNFGIKVGDKRTPWDLMGRFWFTQRFGSELLIVEIFQLPGRMELVIDGADKEKIKQAMSDYLLHEKAPPGWLDKAANWATKRLPDY
jgi:hypothetical protein